MAQSRFLSMLSTHGNDCRFESRLPLLPTPHPKLPLTPTGMTVAY